MRENKDIIAKSRAQVGEGVQLIGRAGGEVEEIIEPVKSFSHLISDITSATREQATTLDLGSIGQSRHSDIACGEEYR